MAGSAADIGAFEAGLSETTHDRRELVAHQAAVSLRRENTGGNREGLRQRSPSGVRRDQRNFQPTVNLRSGLSTKPSRISVKKVELRRRVCMPPKNPTPTSELSSPS